MGRSRFVSTSPIRSSGCVTWTKVVFRLSSPPPYNLGVQYRSYDDGRPRGEYLEWTGRWVKEVTRVLAADGSLFLNVGAKPTDPWTALDVAQAARQHLQLQNLIHWIKSITIEADAAGVRSGLTDDLSVGHYKPINSSRFLNDCQEFVFHFSHQARAPTTGWRLGSVPGRVQRCPLAACRRRHPVPRQYLVHPLRDHPEPRSRSAPPGDVSTQAARIRVRLHELRARIW